MRKTIIFLDPAHGSDVAGKRSPDNSYFEYKWSRTICNDLAIVLRALKFEVIITNTTDKEIGLAKRRSFVESYKTDKIKVLISPHSNGSGDGSEWRTARGFEIWTKKGHDKADILAHLVFKAAESWFPTVKKRYAEDADYKRDKEGELYMTNSNKYFGVLLEWGFHDNKEDVKILLNERYNKALVDCIVDAVEAFEDTV